MTTSHDTLPAAAGAETSSAAPTADGTKTRRSVPWTIGTYAGTKFLGIATTIGLTRLLSPEDFGTVALATVVILVAGLLRDSGLGQALIVRQDATDFVKGVTLALTILTGLVVSLLMVASAPLVASLLGDSRLTAVLSVLAVAVFLGGPATFFDVVLQRELLFKRRFIAQMAQAAVFAVGAIGLAALGWGLWALVIGQLASVVANTIVLLAVAPYRVRLRFDIGIARELFRSGRGFLLQAFTSVVQQNADYLIIGRVLGPTAVGHYFMAFRLAELPFMAISDPVSRVTFPTIARIKAAGKDTRPEFLRGAWLVAFVAMPIATLLSATADPFVRIVLGDQWLPAIGVLTLLGLWGAVRPLQNQYAWYYNAVGEANFIGRLLSVTLCLLIPAMYFAADLSGTECVALVVLGQVCVMQLLFAVHARTRLDLPLRRQLRAFGPVVASCAVAWVGARAMINLVDPEAHAFGSLVAGAGAGLLVYLVAVSLLDRDPVRRWVRSITNSTGA